MTASPPLLKPWHMLGLAASLITSLVIFTTIKLTPSTSSPSIESDQTLYSFFAAGHTYGSIDGNNLGMYPKFLKQFNKLNQDSKLERGFLTGDIVRISDQLSWDVVDQELQKLNMPVHFAPGNHDLTDPDLYQQRYGQTYQAFVHHDDLFIILDPNQGSWNIAGEQLVFLQQTLLDHHPQVDNIFVLHHQLLWWAPDNQFASLKLNSTAGRAPSTNFWSDIEPLFHKLPNQVFFIAGDLGAHAGADSRLEHSYDNITFLASGMGAGAGADNYLEISVLRDKNVEYEFVDF